MFPLWLIPCACDKSPSNENRENLCFDERTHTQNIAWTLHAHRPVWIKIVGISMASLMIKYTVFWHWYFSCQRLTVLWCRYFRHIHWKLPFHWAQLVVCLWGFYRLSTIGERQFEGNMDSTQLWTLLFSYLIAFLMPLCTYKQRANKCCKTKCYLRRLQFLQT